VGTFSSFLSSDSSSQVKKHHHHHQQKNPVGGLLLNREFKNENDLKYRLERISSCRHDARIDKHRPIKKK